MCCRKPRSHHRVASTPIIAFTVAAFLILPLVRSSQHTNNDKGIRRAHSRARAYSTDLARTLSDRRQLCNNHTSLQWILVAPLKAPTIQMIRYAKLQAWILLIVELDNTPPTWQQDFNILWNELAAAGSTHVPHLIFLDRQQQHKLGFASALDGDGNIHSRNIGSLYAIMCGAKLIMEVEDSIEQKDAEAGPGQDIPSGPFPQALGDSASWLINPYALYGHPEMWPRGFPLGAVSNATFEFRKVQQPTPHDKVIYEPLIQSALIDDYPTTAGVLGLTQLAHTGPQDFYRTPKALAIQPGYFAPLNFGSTIYSKDAFWGLPLLAGLHQALAAAWRSLWVQKLLWDVGGRVLVLAPSARQNRSVHSVHLEAMVQEEEVLHKVGPMVHFLHNWESEEEVFHLRLLELARGLTDAGFWAQSELDSMSAWVDDLVALGYVFPDIQAAQQHMPQLAVQPKKKSSAFQHCRNDLWKNVLKAIGNFGPSYTGTSYNGLRTAHMAKAKENVAAYLREWFKAAERTGVVVLSDGWTNMCSRPIINILGSSHKGGYFISAPDVSAAPEKNAHFLYEMWAKAIEDLGEEKVFVMITDGAAVNKAAGALLEERFPHLTWKDHKELLRPGETRFYTAHIMLARLLEMKDVVQRTVVSPEWTEWADKPAYREQAAEVKTILLGDTRGGFGSGLLKQWRSSSQLSSCCGCVMLTTLPWARKRWDAFNSILHCAAFAVDPEFVDIELNAEVMAGF
ncbi:g5413 [Coccomyxa elongata]